MSCDKCLYNKNCQLLAKTKNKDIVGCTAFTSLAEHDKEVIEKFRRRLKQKMHKYALHEVFLTKEYVQRMFRETEKELLKELVDE